jgi:epoxyqueuosine reductase QueG
MSDTLMSTFTDELRAHAPRAGADLLAVAPIERFTDLPPDRHPAAIFPEARSVVVVGKRIARGALRGVEEGTQFDIYRQYGRDWLNNRVLATATFRIAEFLEDAGWEAVPLPNLPPEAPPMGVPVRDGQPAPNVLLDFDDAAVRAGLGEIGYCGLLLTPRFGPRQRIQLILTDADLLPDPLLEEQICARCRDLAAVCPLGAIRREKETVLDVCGKEMPVAGIETAVCRQCKNGAEPNPFHAAGKPDRCSALCTRTCIVNLEEAGRLGNAFTHPFRKRAPWGFVEELRRL